jgi:hypothetical protein
MHRKRSDPVCGISVGAVGVEWLWFGPNDLTGHGWYFCHTLHFMTHAWRTDHGDYMCRESYRIKLTREGMIKMPPFNSIYLL